MKKLIGLSMLLLSGMFFASSAEAKSTGNNLTANNSLAPQFQRRYNQRRVRVTTTTRNVRRGRFLYRETYRTAYRPNGNVVTKLVSRVVIRRY